VGGGGCGGSSSVVVVMLLLVDSGAGLVPVPVSVSVSEPDDSRSQLSATGLDLGLCRGFCGTVVESFSCDSVFAISGGICQWCDQAWVMGWDVPVSLGVLRMDSVADMVANIWDVDEIEYRVQAVSSGNDCADNLQRVRLNFAGLGVLEIWGSCS
jgi:hypothetical protein